MRRATFLRLPKSTSARKSPRRWRGEIGKEISTADFPAAPTTRARRHCRRRSDSNAQFRRYARSVLTQEIWLRVAAARLFVGTGCRCGRNSSRKETSLSKRQWHALDRSCRVRLQNERWGSDLPCRPAVRPPAPPRRKLLPKCRPRFHRHRALRPEDRLRRLPLAVKILPRRATTATAASASR